MAQQPRTEWKPFAYVTCLCPEAKIFQPQLWPELLADPKKIFKPDPVDMWVIRPSGRIGFKWGSPKLFGGPTCSDKEEDLLNLVAYLTGGPDGEQNHETDCYGLVEVPIDKSVQQILAGLIARGFDPMADIKNMEKEVQKEMAEGMETAKRISRERVMRAVRVVWENVQKQHERFEMAGTGKYKPSTTELLCQYVLRDEIQRQRERDEKIQRELEETLTATAGT